MKRLPIYAGSLVSRVTTPGGGGQGPGGNGPPGHGGGGPRPGNGNGNGGGNNNGGGGGIPAAPAPVVESVSSGSGAVSSWSPAAPSGIQVGDGLLLIIFINSTDNPQLSNVTAGTGWRLLNKGEQTSVNGLYAFFKFATGSDGITFSNNNTGHKYVFYRLSGCGGATAISLVGAGKSMPALASQEGAINWRWFAAVGMTGNQTLSAAPSGYGNVLDVANGGVTAVSLSTAHKTNKVATESPGAYTSSGGASTDCLLTIGVAPATTVKDANFSDVLLLLPNEGTAASQVITDVSSSPKTITVNGTAAYSASSSMWRTTVWAGNTSSYFTCPIGVSFTGQFTVEWFSRAQSTGQVCMASESNTNLYMYSGTWRFNGGNISAATSSTYSACYDHWAIDRDASNVIRVYRNGVVLGTTTQSGAQNFTSMCFARYPPNDNLKPAYGLQGVRVTNNRARYGAAFAPPALRFPIAA